MWIPRTGLDMTSGEFNQKNPAELSEQLNIFDILDTNVSMDVSAQKVHEEYREDFEDFEEPLGEL